MWMFFLELMDAAEREFLKARRSKILGLIQSTTDILLQSKAYQDSALHLMELLIYLKCDPIIVEGVQEQLTMCVTHPGTVLTS